MDEIIQMLEKIQDEIMPVMAKMTLTDFQRAELNRFDADVSKLRGEAIGLKLKLEG